MIMLNWYKKTALLNSSLVVLHHSACVFRHCKANIGLFLKLFAELKFMKLVLNQYFGGSISYVHV